MRFIVMHKVDAKMEAGTPPDEDIIRDMGSLVRESLSSGVFLNGAGLHASSKRVRIAFKGGARSVQEGPFSGKHELVAAFFMTRAPSMSTAIEQASELAAVLGDVEIEIGPVVEPWDIGVMPKPADPGPGRFLLLQKSDARSEAGTPLSAKQRAALDALRRRWTAEGVLLAADELSPSSRGTRLASAPKGKRRWVDGPFAESKELIAGFSILRLPSRADAVSWAERYASILDGNEVDVLELPDDDA